MIIIRAGCAFDIAEQDETEKALVFLLAYNGPKWLQSSKTDANDRKQGKNI